ncbi:MAG: M23 family metallopeptidase [Saprospiraceae bacterium]|nr:M23 family metallopeptidase [Saprospiraceae bacterium]
MAKTKYHFNTKSLEVEKVKLTFKDRLLKALVIVSSGAMFSISALALMYYYFPSPKEKALKRENQQYKLQYEVLNNRLDNVLAVLEDIQKRDDDIYRVIFEAEPVPANERQAGYGGADRYESLKGYKNSDLIIETTQKIDKISRQLYVQSKSFDKVFDLAKKKNEMLACIPAIQPVSNKDLRRIASGFGYRIHPIYKTLRMHTGMDFSAPRGTPIYATGNGKVMNSNRMSGYGKVCIIDHGYGYKTLYGHMSKIIVKAGQKVKRGEIIGYVGSSGTSTSPHLHYEVRINDKPVNPVHYFFNDLSPEEYEKVIEISSRINQSLS